MTTGVRRFYAVVVLCILAAEVLIALFVRDIFLRPYGGDILAAVFVYCLVRLLVPATAKKMAPMGGFRPVLRSGTCAEH